VDTYSKVACAKLYTSKTPITAADLLNDSVLPLFAEHGLPILRLLRIAAHSIAEKLKAMIINFI